MKLTHKKLRYLIREAIKDAAASASGGSEIIKRVSDTGKAAGDAAKFHKVIKNYSGFSRNASAHRGSADGIAKSAECYALGDGEVTRISLSGNKYNKWYKLVTVTEAEKQYPGMGYSWTKLKAGSNTWIPQEKSKEYHKKIGEAMRTEVGEMWDKAMSLPAGTMDENWFKENYPYKTKTDEKTGEEIVTRSLSPWSNSGAEGNQLTIKLDKEIDIEGFKVKYVTYTHLDGTFAPAKGDRVTKGQSLGKTSRNGQITGEHLHLQLTNKNKRKPPSNSEGNKIYKRAFEGPDADIE